jgi:outer membrane receptor protein involved in Fe transport
MAHQIHCILYTEYMLHIDNRFRVPDDKINTHVRELSVGFSILKSTAAACALSIAASAAMAQTTPSNVPSAPGDAAETAADNGGISEVVVTAQKREQKLMSVGITVNTATKIQLQNAGVTDIFHLANVVSGFTAATSENDLPVFSIRGLGFTSDQLSASPTVSAYIDEAPLPYSAMTGGTTLDVERVEVLKGPQGTLFGNNSTGGSINFIAAKPTPDFTAGITATTDRFGQLSGEGFVSGPLTDTLQARLAVSTTQGGNWQHTYTPGPYLESGAAKKGAERLLLDWQPTDQLKISLNLNSYYDDSDPQQVQFSEGHPGGGPGTAYVNPRYGSIETYPLPPHDDRAADFAYAGATSNTFYQSVLRADYDLNDSLTLTSLTNYAHLRSNINREDDGTRIDIIDGVHDGTIQTYGEEIRLTGDLQDIGVHFIAGGNYSYDTVSETQNFNNNHLSIFPPDFVTSFHGAFTSATTAGFANVEWKVTDQITLLGGARYTLDQQTDSACLPSGDPTVASFFGGLANAYRKTFSGLGPTNAYQVGTCSTIGPAPNYLPFTYGARSADHNVSWRAGINYQLADDLMLYALISRGYKAGAYPVLVAVLSSSLNKVQQEEVTSYEGGVKYSIGNILRLSAAGYYYDYTNKQTYALVPAPLLGVVDTLINIPQSKAYGFDAEATLAPVHGLTLHSAVTYTRTAITDAGALSLDVFGRPLNFVGHPFTYAPKWSAVFDAEYRMPLTDNIDGVVGANGNYVSGQFGDLSTEAPFKVDPYLTVDGRIGLDSADGWRATAWIRNITNKYYWNSANFNEDGFFRTTGMPRNFGVTLAYRFGGSNQSAPTETPATYVPPPVRGPQAAASYLVFFDFNKSELTPQALSIVDQAARNVGPAKVTQLTVTGHTDTVGSDAYNMRLSRRRAESVAAQLEKDGIPSSEIEIVAKGKRDLLVPTADGVREPQNRRVQIVYVQNATS